MIAFIWYEGDEEEKNLNTLLDLLNESETREMCIRDRKKSVRIQEIVPDRFFDIFI